MSQFIYLGNNISSIVNGVNIRIDKKWTAIHSLSTIWQSILSDEIKQEFFQLVIISILLYGRTILTVTERLEKKLDKNYTKIFFSKKSLKQHSTKQLLYNQVSLISITIRIRKLRHCWGRKNKQMLMNTPLSSDQQKLAVTIHQGTLGVV